MSSTEVLPTHTPALFERAAQRAAELLRSGAVVALPTETVYGLAANALDARAVERIYEIKGRPAHNPIIVHVNSQHMAEAYAADWPPMARSLASAFWPGPLTVVVRKAAAVPDIVTAGGDTVGLRWPSHPFMRAVIDKCGFPLAAPSANRSNHLSPTNAEHVRTQLGNQLPLIVDGGQCQVGIESTVVDVTGDEPVILRPGMIHEESLQAVTGRRGARAQPSDTLRSPGLLSKHYAPRARLLVLAWVDEADLQRQLAAVPISTQGLHVVAHTHIPTGASLDSVSVIPHDPEAFARALYAELHRCDAANARTIVVEAVPGHPEWEGILDRLNRAGASHSCD